MSAWPQAVWLKKQLANEIQYNFQMSSSIEQYQNTFNTEFITPLNLNIDRLDNATVQIQQLQSLVSPPYILPSTATISDPKNKAIWFVIEEQGV